MAKGPWYGHEFDDVITYPFMLRALDEIFWGYEEHTSEPTNVGTKLIQVGELITVGEGPETSERFGERIYQIIALHNVR